MNQSTTGNDYWHISIDADQVAWLEFDKPGSNTNTLSRAAMVDLDTKLAELEKQRPRAVVVMSAKSGGFIAGADIKEFAALDNPAQGYELVRSAQRVIDRLAQLPCPTVAAMHGFALGGGLELALACRYRIAPSDSKMSLGLPEVQLGIHPGFGGTVRAVQLLGPTIAMDLMLTGKSITADKARQIGLLDQVAPLAELRASAKQLVLAVPKPHRPALFASLLNISLLRPFVANKMRQKVQRQVARQHYPAPYALIDLWQQHGGQGVAAYEAEARSIAALFCTPGIHAAGSLEECRREITGTGQPCAGDRRWRNGRRYCQLVRGARFASVLAGSCNGVCAASTGSRQGIFRETLPQG
jgi:3-hydroxyacyl-CoA dehydrogenase / enoyl-CoA hydratase / 3-hydroxybutyryl-CoA epimerase